MAAVAFTPSVTTPFSHADFALSYCTDVAQGITGAANLDVTLAADAGGFPGHPIETIHTTNAFNSQCTAAILTAASSLQPNLVKGVQYWLIVSPPDLLHTQFFWLIGPAGAPNTLAPGQFLLQLNLPASSFKYASVGNGLMGFNPPFAVFGGSPVTAATAVAANGVVSAASYTAPVSGGSWTAVFGTALSLTSRGWRSRDFDSTQLPVSLDNVSVIVGGIPTAVSYISPGQVNVQFPDVPSWSFLALQVISPQDASAPIMFRPPLPVPLYSRPLKTALATRLPPKPTGRSLRPHNRRNRVPRRYLWNWLRAFEPGHRLRHSRLRTSAAGQSWRTVGHYRRSAGLGVLRWNHGCRTRSDQRDDSSTRGGGSIRSGHRQRLVRPGWSDAVGRRTVQ